VLAAHFAFVGIGFNAPGFGSTVNTEAGVIMPLSDRILEASSAFGKGVV